MYCVIMGDIVDSNGLSDDIRVKVHQEVKIAFERINSKYMDSFLANLGWVRGDSFEGVLLAQHNAPQIVQDIIKAFYRAEKTLVRISVMMGQLTITSSDRNEIDGPVFKNVLAALEKIKERKSKHWLQVSFDIGLLGQSLISSQLGLLAALTERWTDRQREACWVAEDIEGHETYQKDPAKQQDLIKLVANKVDSPTSIIKKQLNAASYEAYRYAWDAITEYLIAIDEHTISENKTIMQESYLPYLNIGERKVQQYNHDEALPILEKALALAKKELGDDDMQLIRIYTNLADAYIQTLKPQDAEDVIQKAFSLQTGKPKTLEYIKTLLIQSQIHLCKYDIDSAKSIAEEAMTVANGILSPSALFWKNIYNTLAMGADDYEVALDYHKKCLAIEENVSDTSIDYAVAIYNIAICYYMLKRYEEAQLSMEESLKIYEMNLPQGHKDVKDARHYLDVITKAKKGEPT